MKKSFARGVFLVAAFAALSAASSSYGGSVTLVPVDYPGTNDGQLNLAGTKTTDIMLGSAGTSILSQQLRLTLTTGSVINHPFGGNTPPNPALIPAFGSLAWDSFVSAGTATGGATDPAPTLVGRSDALGGPGGVPATFTPTEWDALWGPALGQDTAEKNNFLSARLTLSGDANGLFQYQASFGDGLQRLVDLQIVNGTIIQGQPNVAPVVDDIAGIIPVVLDMPVPPLPPSPTTAMVQFVATDDAPLAELSWSLESFVYNGTGTNTGAQPTVDASGKLSWPADGWAGGEYIATVRATDAGGLSDIGSVTFNLTVPEPASLALFGLALVGFAGFRRK